VANTARSAFVTKIGYNLSGLVPAAAEYNAAIDAAIEAVLQEHTWKELKSRDTSVQTVADTQYIAVPSDLEELLAVQLIDQASVTACTCDDSDNSVLVAATTGQYDDGTAVQVTAGTVGSTNIVLNTEYFLGQLGGASPSWTYRLYTSKAYAELNDTTTGLFAIGADGTGFTFLIGDGLSSYNVPVWTKEEAEGRYPVADLRTSADPEACYHEGDRIYFVPTPSAVWTARVSYRATLTLGALTTDTISTDGFDGLIIAMATSLLHEDDENDVSASRWLSRYQWRVARKYRSQRNSGVTRQVDLRVRSVLTPQERNPLLALPFGKDL